MYNELAFVSLASLLTSFFLMEAFRGVCELMFWFSVSMGRGSGIVVVLVFVVWCVRG